MFARMKCPFLSSITFGALLTSAPAAIDFARDVRPIFSENCFACHGPDANKRKAGLRLDEKESAFQILESGERAIVAGDVRWRSRPRMSAKPAREVRKPPAGNCRGLFV